MVYAQSPSTSDFAWIESEPDDTAPFPHLAVGLTTEGDVRMDHVHVPQDRAEAFATHADAGGPRFPRLTRWRDLQLEHELAPDAAALQARIAIGQEIPEGEVERDEEIFGFQLFL